MSVISLNKSIRITVVGDGDTGKTCLLIVFKDKKFDDRYIPTVFDVYSMTIPINYEEHTIILSDTAGQEEFDKLRKLAYRDADVFILCYSIAERSSFENISLTWAPEVKRCKPNAKIILVATKIDLLSARKVTPEEGEALAREIGASGFIETSAKNCWNVEAAFQMAIWSVVSARRGRKKFKSQCFLL
ncbi:transforming protein RhoA-like [Cylas formicarius]|uniref:transforming protein RhoA-like n=1 Tax=Cylas formicarius TaxID=197179 RepID=UPI0029584571|nr:transforming protein RhoA-like [Cylas formicarius]XP_060533284.1 transforming protein RhoA-like [Cylas formicarius]